MVKEYDDLKGKIKAQNPYATDEVIEQTTKTVFTNIFNLSVEEANQYSAKGDWNSYLKSNSAKKKSPTKYCVHDILQDIEIKEETNGDLYIFGWASSGRPDSKKEIVSQDELFEQYNDENNIYSKFLSYKHGWLMGAEEDPKPLGRLILNEIRYNPKIQERAVYLGFKISKTHPKFDEVRYDLKERIITGLSIEYQVLEYHWEVMGNITVKKIDKLKLRGTGLVNRPINEDATLEGYFVKEFYYDGGEDDMNVEVKGEAAPAATAGNPAPVAQPTQAPVAQPTQVPVAQPTTNNSNENANADKLAQLEKQLLEKDAIIKKQEEDLKSKEAVKAAVSDLAGLQAKKTVLVDGSEQNAVTADPTLNAERMAFDDLKKIAGDKSIPLRDRVANVANAEFKKMREQIL